MTHISTHVIILTDSMNLLQKVESGMGCPNWYTAMPVFGCKDFCGSTALGIRESVGMNRQVDWQGQQISHLQGRNS